MRGLGADCEGGCLDLEVGRDIENGLEEAEGGGDVDVCVGLADGMV